MLPPNLSFVDIETTGTRSSYDRIIEIGIVRVEDGIIVKTYQTLINPQSHLPHEITRITGITENDLEDAPTFRQVKDEILETLIESTFVAHNVRFDYGFLKNEFKRENISYSSKHFCTVRLSRLLFPQFRHHNLDSIIERFNIVCQNRHRAFDDAKVLCEFYQRVQKEIQQEKFYEAVSKCLKKPSLPLNLTTNDLENLPEEPGVYIFYREDKTPLYIGKSKNIKNRVLNHFASDITLGSDMKISQQIASIETRTTAGELGALFLESQLIKKYLPIYNKKSRIKRELIAVKSLINRDGYQTCVLEPLTVIRPDDLETFVGFFKSRKQAKSYLTEITKKYSLCEKLTGLENTKKSCFGYRLQRCKGACLGKEKSLLYNLRFLTAFSMTKIKSWPFSGPIVVEEQTMDGKKEHFVLDKWCFLGSICTDTEGNIKNNLFDDVVFDLDIYQILKQYIKNNYNKSTIKKFLDYDM